MADTADVFVKTKVCMGHWKGNIVKFEVQRNNAIKQGQTVLDTSVLDKTIKLIYKAYI